MKQVLFNKLTITHLVQKSHAISLSLLCAKVNPQCDKKYFSKIHFNTAPPFTPKSRIWSLPFIRIQFSYALFFFFHAAHMFAHLILFDVIMTTKYFGQS